MMLKNHIYLDFNATSLPVPGVKEAVCQAIDEAGNPSSVHFFGQRARKSINVTRKRLASLIEALEEEIYFTGSGTEANAMALLGVPSAFIITSSIEHVAVFENLKHRKSESYEVIPVSQEGILDLEALDRSLHKAPKPSLVSVMLANNETGVVQPIKEIVQIAKKYNAWVHTDAIQAFGKIGVSFKDLGVDMMTISSHKSGGPQGVGIFVKKKTVPFEALYFGGGQERGLHHGTENLIGLAGFGAALKKIDLKGYKKLKDFRDNMETILQNKVPGLKIPSQKVDRLPNTSCLCMPDVENSLQLIALDLSGIAASTGAACSSGKVKNSSVLRAMGYTEEEAKTALRVSFGWSTTEKEIEIFTKKWLEIYTNQHKKNKRR